MQNATFLCHAPERDNKNEPFATTVNSYKVEDCDKMFHIPSYSRQAVWPISTELWIKLWSTRFLSLIDIHINMLAHLLVSPIPFNPFRSWVTSYYAWTTITMPPQALGRHKTFTSYRNKANCSIISLVNCCCVSGTLDKNINLFKEKLCNQWRTNINQRLAKMCGLAA